MDWVTWKQDGLKHLQKYKYAALLLLLGIFLMALPQKQEPQDITPPTEDPQPQLQQSLTEILSRVEGAGKVQVLLTEAAGARTVYQMDENSSSSEHGEERRLDTVLVTTASREETGLIRQTIPPTYRGAIVLCQGADKAQVRLDMVEAVMSVTGLGADKISVLKMK